jgi:hypothetical protein
MLNDLLINLRTKLISPLLSGNTGNNCVGATITGWNLGMLWWTSLDLSIWDCDCTIQYNVDCCSEELLGTATNVTLFCVVSAFCRRGCDEFCNNIL